MMPRILDMLRRYLVALTWVYFTFLFLWATAYFLTGDRYGVFAIANLVAPYLFVPLIAVAPLALLTSRRELYAGFAIGVLVFLGLWGGQFVPRPHRIAAGDTLSVMTYNTLGYQHEVGPIIELLRAESPDVVFFQELNTSLLAAIEKELAQEYPFRVADPVDNPEGMGVVSKYPLRVSSDSLPLSWVGEPQLLSLDWDGLEVRLINFHMWAVSIASPDYIALNYRAREAQALYLADYARVTSRQIPVVVAGDANVTHLSDAYRLITDVLTDAWMEAGFGLGHTYPGEFVYAGDQDGIGTWRGPRWVARIDYIFHSDHWEAVDARLMDSEAVSDHRAVIAVLRLKNSAGRDSRTIDE